jgi:polyhydroxyalkanoate synthesis regulator phasin
MFDLIKKTMLVGLGLAFLTKEKIVELSTEFAQKGKLSEREGKRFFDELLKRSEDARKEVRRQIEKMVKEALKKINLTTRDDLLKLEKQLNELRKAIKDRETKG